MSFENCVGLFFSCDYLTTSWAKVLGGTLCSFETFYFFEVSQLLQAIPLNLLSRTTLHLISTLFIRWSWVPWKEAETPTCSLWEIHGWFIQQSSILPVLPASLMHPTRLPPCYFVEISTVLLWASRPVAEQDAELKLGKWTLGKIKRKQREQKLRLKNGEKYLLWYILIKRA